MSYVIETVSFYTAAHVKMNGPVWHKSVVRQLVACRQLTTHHILHYTKRVARMVNGQEAMWEQAKLNLYLQIAVLNCLRNENVRHMHLSLHFHLGFVYPLQGVALHQSLSLLSI